MSSTPKKDYIGIDIIKLIMAIFVVAIHTHPFEGLQENIFTQSWNILVCLAVPYFFITSGFLLYSKVNNAEDKASQLFKIKQYVIRIIKLYLYWTIIFLPITIWKFVINDSHFFMDFLIFIRGVFFIGENYYSWPLWYLLSMIYSLVLIYFLIYKNVKLNSILLFSVFIFLISTFMNFIIDSEDTYDLILLLKKGIEFTFENGRLFSGMLYMMIGALFVNKKINFSKGMWILLFFVGFIFQYFKLPIISSFLFVLLPTIIFYISLNLKLKTFKLGYFIRKCSTVMYFTHMLVFFFYTLIFKEFTYYGWDAFLISILIPIILTPIIIKNENKSIFLNKIF